MVPHNSWSYWCIFLFFILLFSHKTENNFPYKKDILYLVGHVLSVPSSYLLYLVVIKSYGRNKIKMFNKNVEDQTELVIDACRTSFVDNSDNPGLMKDNVNDLLASSTTGFIVIILISYLVFKFLI